MLFFSLLSSIIDFQVELELARVAELTEKDVPEGRFLGLVVEASDNGLPIVNEGTRIISHKLNLQEVLDAIQRPSCFVGFKELFEHEENLPPTNRSPSCSFRLFVVDDLSVQFTFCDYRKCVEDLGVKGDELACGPKCFASSRLLINLLHPVESFIWSV